MHGTPLFRLDYTASSTG